jgi:hypothetical protein
VAAAVAALIYGGTLAPTVGAGDSGELILAAESLGVPHPPGYPLWTLLARLAAIVPVGTVALRVNALSTLLSAVGVGLLYLLARRVGLKPFAAALAAALFGAATVIWRSAVEAEVYPLATALFLALALLALRARRAGPRGEAAFFYAAGLAILAHQTLLFPALLLGAWTLARRPAPGGPAAERRAPRRLLAGAAWAALGASLVLYLPIRGAAHPSFAWTEGGGLRTLVDDFLRRGYGGLRQNPLRLDLMAGEAWGMATAVAGALGLAGAILAAAGALRSGRERGAIRVVALAALTVPVALILLLSFTPDAEHLAQVSPFLSPAVAVSALLAGAGAQAIARLAPRRARPAALAALAACVLGTVAAHRAACDRSDFRLAERYGRDLIRDLAPGATLILEGDNETFLAAYATRLERVRPDVTLIHRRGYVFGDPYGLRGVPRSEWEAIADRADLERLNAPGQGAVYYAAPPEGLVAAGARFTSEGLVHRASAPGARPPAPWLPNAAWPKSGDLLTAAPAAYDYVTRKLAISYSDAAARALWSAGRHAEAFPWFQDAARVGFDFPEARINLATAAAAVGNAELALDELLAARSLAPRNPEAAGRLGVFLSAAGRPGDAAVWFEKAYRLGPAPARAGDAARAWALAGDDARARYWTDLAAGRIPG